MLLLSVSNSAFALQRPPAPQVRQVELPLLLIDSKISPSLALFFQAAANLPSWEHGAVSLPSSDFTSTSLHPREGWIVDRTLEGTVLVGPPLFITQTNTSCCPSVDGEDQGACRMEKSQRGAVKQAQLHTQGLVLGASQELNIAPVRGRAGVVRSPWKAFVCVNESYCRKLNILLC